MGSDGSLAIEYSINSAVTDAKAYVYATKHEGQWILDKLIVATNMVLVELFSLIVKKYITNYTNTAPLRCAVRS